MSRYFGAIRQNGYVVRDIEAALQHWTTVLGVGPFYYLEHVTIENFQYNGAPTSADMSVALANSGSLQIELIQQRNDEPSMVRDFLRAGREGLQHVAYWMDTPAQMDAALKKADELGYEVGQSGVIGENGRFAYLKTEAHPGTVIELSEVCGWKAELFQQIADAAEGWAGSDPIRRVQR